MKKLLWLLVLCLTLCACGGNTDTKPAETETEPVVQEESPKGSRENPYRVGETIRIDEMYPVSEHPASQIPFRMELTVTKAYTPEESEADRVRRLLPVAQVSLSVDGAYEGSLELDQFFYRPLLTAEQEKVWPQTFTRDVREVTALEVGEDYELVLTVYQEDQNAPVESYPYLMLSYFYPDSDTVNELYIDLTGNQSTEPAEEAPELTEEEKTQYYEAAAEAEAKGYYAVAKNLYEDIPGYKDANVRCEAVRAILAPYNGTYYGESQVHEDVSVWVYVQDGAVWATYDVDATPVLAYELFRYGTGAEDTPVMAFSTGLTRFFLDNHNASYTQGFTLTQEGENWRVQATEGAADQSWNSVLEKVSDTIPQDLSKN